jgi:hypothetical protein
MTQQQPQEPAATEAATSGVPDYIESLAKKVNMDPRGYLQTVSNDCKPGGKRDFTPEERAKFLSTAARYELDPLIGEIYAFPKTKGGIQIIIGIDGWLKIINNRADFNGMEFEEHFDDQGYIHSVTATIYRRNIDHPFVVTEYYHECQQDTIPWKKWPIRMTRWKAAIQCARVAFNLSGIIDPDEANRHIIAGVLDMVDLPPGESAMHYQEDHSRTDENLVRHDPGPSPSAQKKANQAKAPPETKANAATGRQRGTLNTWSKKGGATPEQYEEFMTDRGTPIDELTKDQASDLLAAWAHYEGYGEDKKPKEPDFSELHAWLEEKGYGSPVEESEDQPAEPEEDDELRALLLQESVWLDDQPGGDILAAMNEADLGGAILTESTTDDIEKVVKIMREQVKAEEEKPKNKGAAKGSKKGGKK